MHSESRHKVAGYLAWVAVAAPTVVDLSAGRLTGLRALLWIFSFLVFGLAYALYLRPSHPHRSPSRAPLWLSAMAATGLTMVLSSVGLMKYLASITLTIVAAELPYAFPARMVTAWIALQGLALCAIFWLSFGWLSGVAGGVAYAGFQAFAVGRSWGDLREREARRELERAHASLLATSQLLAEHSRVAERLRISRDLHDALGHHLTGLSIHLDAASRTVDGPGRDLLRQAHAITRLLLADVRAVVGELRSQGDVDIAEALRTLGEGSHPLRVHVDVPDVLRIPRPEMARALFRCAQEIITNALRHSGGAQLSLRVFIEGDSVVLDATDDGLGTSILSPGMGLAGMRERFEELGGTLEFHTAPGRGFTAHGQIPLTRRDA